MARPDTRSFLGVSIDSGVVRQVAQTFLDSLPNETGVCLTVAVRDTVVGGARRMRIAQVVRSDPALVAIATPYSVTYDTTRFYVGCASIRQFARGHSHPYTFDQWPCTHSDTDAKTLASDSRVLFSLIFCGSGRGEVLWQDGRRHSFAWAPVSLTGVP